MNKLNYKTYQDLLLDIKRNIYKIPTNIDLIVGIPRSGMIPAYMLGLALNKRVCSLNEYLNGQVGGHGQTRAIPYTEEIKNIIIVDDSVCSGNSIQKAKGDIETLCINAHVHFVAVYANIGSEQFVDIALCVLPVPRMFQWNYMNHSNLELACLDIDGVLCIDPTEEENDDGDKYINFILNAKPLYIPQYKVLALITSRLEKYRKETELWLKNNNIQYGELYMLNLSSKEERIQLGSHALFKGEMYNKLTNSCLFIESNRKQAITIAKLTNKAVFCVETDELINNSNMLSLKILRSKKQKVKYFILHLIPTNSLRTKMIETYRKLKNNNKKPAKKN